jgi:hypothetical protein
MSGASERQGNKDDIIRCLRLGQIRRLCRARCGHVLPDDDAGREYLYEILLPTSFGPNADIKMPKAIEVWAPWMGKAEAAELIDRINQMPIGHRKPTGRVLGERLRVSNQERQQWRLWTIKPYDMTDEQLTEWRRERDRERKRQKRQRPRPQGRLTRQQWLARNRAKDRPWQAYGIKERAYYYRLKKYGTADIAVVASAMKLNQHRTQPLQRRKRGVSKGVGRERTINEAQKPSACRPRLATGIAYANYVDAGASN